ncbi:MAG: hypothetical protein AAGH15_07625, partial [Myxococcota bacterium]
VGLLGPGEGPGVVYAYRREGEAWMLEASLRPDWPPIVPHEVGFGERVAVRGGTVLAQGSGSRVVVFRRDAAGAWSGPSTLPGRDRVVAFSLVDEETVATLREPPGGRGVEFRLEVMGLDGVVRLAVDVGYALALAVAGETLVVSTPDGLLVGSAATGLERLPLDVVVTQALAPVADDLVLATARGGRYRSEGLMSLAQEGGRWSVTAFERPETSREEFQPIAVLPDWVAVGAPGDSLREAYGIGADPRQRPGPWATQGTVFLYPRAVDGRPRDEPHYLRPFDDRVGARFGAALATDGTYLFVGAPNDPLEEAIPPDASRDWASETPPPRPVGSVSVWRLQP